MNGLAPLPLTVCAVFRDEGPYLREWIEFHRLVGVERFYLYDNDSSDESWEVLVPYMREGVVQVMSWPGAARQLDAYQHALSTWGRATRWMAFLDIDEFMFSPTGQTISTVLKYYVGIAALGACWACYGTSDVEHRPDRLVTETYQWRTRDEALNRHVKSIVRTARAIDRRPLDPHHFIVDGRSVDEKGRDLQGPFAATPTHELIRVNHYISKSQDEARAKQLRPRADTGTLREMDLCDVSLNAQFDPVILPWMNTLREHLGAVAA